VLSRLAKLVLHPNAREIIVRFRNAMVAEGLVLSLLNVHTLLVNWEVRICFHVGVDDHYSETLVFFDFSVELFDLVKRKSLIVKHKILIVLCVVQVHPQHIYLETMLRKQCIPFAQQLGRNICPLAKVEA